MQTNYARRKLLDGGFISGPSITYSAPEIVEEALQHDFDYLWLEWQHGGWTETTLNGALGLCVGHATAPVVRMPGLEPSWIGRVLDLGAMGVIIPMVETAEQCEQIVQATKFPPRGGRSATGFRTAHLSNNDFFEYVHKANDEILVVPMVESPVAVGNVREMMAVPDIDCILIGPYDLSLSAGAESMSDDIVEDLVHEVLAASKETGVAAGYVTNGFEEAKRRVDEGFRMVCPGHDLFVVRSGFAEMKASADRL